MNIKELIDAGLVKPCTDKAGNIVSANIFIALNIILFRKLLLRLASTL